MAVDTRGLCQEHIGKRLCVHFESGEISEISLLNLSACEKSAPCCSITYVLLSTNRIDCSLEKGTAYWAGFGDIKNFQVLENE
jgi:hypothetical protein